MVRIITDTTASLPSTVAQRYQVPIIPQIINFGSESFREGVDLDTETFVRKLRTGRVLPKTAAPPPQAFCQVFEQLARTGETIICLHPSSEVSGTVRSARLAAVDFPRTDIRIVDTRTIAFSLGYIVLRAVEWAAADVSADTILQRVNDLILRSRTYFRVATLDYLARGGRIGGAAALLGSVLQVKPILTIRDGIIDQYARERTERNAILRLTSILTQQCPQGNTGAPALMYDGTDEQRGEAERLALLFGSTLQCEPLPLYVLPPAIVTHAGPGVIGVGFFKLEAPNAG